MYKKTYKRIADVIMNLIQDLGFSRINLDTGSMSGMTHEKNSFRGFTHTHMRTHQSWFNFIVSFIKSFFTIPKSNRAYVGGFTLAETLIAMMIFTTIVVFGISALVNMTRDYRTTGEMRQSLDSLNYVMEDISRNIRLGTTFSCVSNGQTSPNYIATPPPFNLTSCGTEQPNVTLPHQGALGLTFSAYDSNFQNNNAHQLMYMIGGDQCITQYKCRLYKASFTTSNPLISTTPPGLPFYEMTPENVTIDGIKSGFSIFHNDSPNIAPAISVRLAGTISYQNTIVPFDIQTTITPRNRQ